MEKLIKHSNGQWTLVKAKDTSKHGNFGGGNSFDGGDQYVPSKEGIAANAARAAEQKRLEAEASAVSAAHKDVADRGEVRRRTEPPKTVEDHPLHGELVNHFKNKHGLDHHAAFAAATHVMTSGLGEKTYESDSDKAATGSGAAEAKKILAGKVKTKIS